MEYKKIIDDHINDYLTKNISNPNLVREVKYVLKDGKRLRPIISLDMYYSLYKKIDDKILNYSMFIEFLHNASLIIDDLPYMDNDNIRRNQLTLHHKYNISTSNLISNFLISKSLKKISLISKSLKNNDELVKMICQQTKMASLGQYYDLYNKHKTIRDICLKTSPFFIMAFVGPFLFSKNIDKKQLKDIIELAIHFSIAFQICDDIEDIHSNDINNYVKIYGLEKCIFLYKENIQNFEKLCRKMFFLSTTLKNLINLLNEKFTNCIYDQQKHC